MVVSQNLPLNMLRQSNLTPSHYHGKSFEIAASQMQDL
jgi:hypothetical protein